MTYNIIVLLLLHLLACLIYSAFILHKKTLQQSVYRFIVVLFLPVLGFLFFIISGIFGKFLKETENIGESYQDYVRDSNQTE